ncbi:MAG TPA: DUF3024 domain-containing protein [Bacteroidales bacterium]|nr:DUF3024 domain-containing protein [Bacteroidales bacterium]
MEYRIKGHEVVIYSRRPRWDNPKEWIETPEAKMKYVRTSNIWQLFWPRANGRWVSYEPLSFSRDLRSLVEEVDKDPLGCFFG